MFCTNCGTALENNTAVCPNCGTQLPKSEPANATATPQQPVSSTMHTPVITNIIPEENQPLSAWAYFGLQILFAIPIVGFIFLIVFSCNGSNINRRNFARSYWCGLILVAIILVIVMLFASAAGSTAWCYI